MNLQMKSLRWRLVRNLVLAHIATIALAGVVLFSIVMFYLVTDPEKPAFGPIATTTLSEAVTRDPNGKLVLRNTGELQSLRASSTGFWFVISDARGQRLAEGHAPPELASYGPAIDQIDGATFRSLPGRSVADRISVTTLPTDAGEVKIVLGGEGVMQPLAMPYLASSVLWQTLIIAGLVSASTLLIVPFVVRRSLRTLQRTAQEASQLDLEKGKKRLSEVDIPEEVVPVVSAVNHALDRLDRVMKKQQRFITDAAHELRTPVAILSTRLAALPASPLKQRLLEDASRLASLSGQLLDVHRFESESLPLACHNLVEVARAVVLDMAPLAFAAGYEVAFDADAEDVPVAIDRQSVERALTNLIQNAINYGGRSGQITILVNAQRQIDVIDQGAGVPPADQQRIFEAFQRGSKDGRGVGLGLDLVQQIMLSHGGEVILVEGTQAGAMFRLSFPNPR